MKLIPARILPIILGLSTCLTSPGKCVLEGYVVDENQQPDSALLFQKGRAHRYIPQEEARRLIYQTENGRLNNGARVLNPIAPIEPLDHLVLQRTDHPTMGLVGQALCCELFHCALFPDSNDYQERDIYFVHQVTMQDGERNPMCHTYGSQAHRVNAHMDTPTHLAQLQNAEPEGLSRLLMSHYLLAQSGFLHPQETNLETFRLSREREIPQLRSWHPFRELAVGGLLPRPNLCTAPELQQNIIRGNVREVFSNRNFSPESVVLRWLRAIEENNTLIAQCDMSYFQAATHRLREEFEQLGERQQRFQAHMLHIFRFLERRDIREALRRNTTQRERLNEENQRLEKAKEEAGFPIRLKPGIASFLVDQLHIIAQLFRDDPQQEITQGMVLERLQPQLHAFPADPLALHTSTQEIDFWITHMLEQRDYTRFQRFSSAFLQTPVQRDRAETVEAFERIEAPLLSFLRDFPANLDLADNEAVFRCARGLGCPLDTPWNPEGENLLHQAVGLDSTTRLRALLNAGVATEVLLQTPVGPRTPLDVIFDRIALQVLNQLRAQVSPIDIEMLCVILQRPGAGCRLEQAEKAFECYQALKDNGLLTPQTEEAFRTLAKRHQKFSWLVVLEDAFPSVPRVQSEPATLLRELADHVLTTGLQRDEFARLTESPLERAKRILVNKIEHCLDVPLQRPHVEAFLRGLLDERDEEEYQRARNRRRADAILMEAAEALLTQFDGHHTLYRHLVAYFTADEERDYAACFQDPQPQTDLRAATNLVLGGAHDKLIESITLPRPTPANPLNRTLDYTRALEFLGIRDEATPALQRSRLLIYLDVVDQDLTQRQRGSAQRPPAPLRGAEWRMLDQPASADKERHYLNLATQRWRAKTNIPNAPAIATVAEALESLRVPSETQTIQLQRLRDFLTELQIPLVATVNERDPAGAWEEWIAEPKLHAKAAQCLVQAMQQQYPELQDFENAYTFFKHYALYRYFCEQQLWRPQPVREGNQPSQREICEQYFAANRYTDAYALLLEHAHELRGNNQETLDALLSVFRVRPFAHDASPEFHRERLRTFLRETSLSPAYREQYRIQHSGGTRDLHNIDTLLIEIAQKINPAIGSLNDAITLLDITAGEEPPQARLIHCLRQSGLLEAFDRENAVPHHILEDNPHAQPNPDEVVLLNVMRRYIAGDPEHNILGHIHTLERAACYLRPGGRRWIESAESGLRQLIPDIERQLWINGRFSRMESGQHGRRNVRLVFSRTGLLGDQGVLFVKKLPELPGFEAATRNIVLGLIGHGVPYSELVSIQGVPYLISQGFTKGTGTFRNREGVATPFQGDLRTFQKRNRQLLRQRIQSQLDEKSVMELILASMVLFPEDGKLDNFVFDPVPDMEARPEEQRYRLVSIDNDHAFAPTAEISDTVQEKIQVNTCLFALGRVMSLPIPPEVARRFVTQLDIVPFIQNRLREFIQLNERYNTLFGLKGYFCQTHESYLAIPFTITMLNALYDRLFFLKEVLTPVIEHHSTVLPKQVLTYIAPVLASSSRYGRFWRPDAYLYAVDDPNIQNLRTSTSNQFLSRAFHLPPQVQAQLVERDISARVYTPQIALTEFQRRTEGLEQRIQKQDTEKTFEDFSQMGPFNDPTRAPSQYQLRRFCERLSPVRWNERQKQTLIESLQQASAHQALRDLIVRHNSQLTFTHFTGPSRFACANLYSLNVSGCRQLGADFVQHIARSAPMLRQLDISGINSEDPLSQGNDYLMFPVLRELKANHLSDLQRLRLDVPFLRTLEVRNCRQLRCVEILARPGQRRFQSADFTGSVSFNDEDLERFLNPEIRPSITSLSVEGTGVETPILHELFPQASTEEVRRLRGNLRAVATALTRGREVTLSLGTQSRFWNRDTAQTVADWFIPLFMPTRAGVQWIIRYFQQQEQEEAIRRGTPQEDPVEGAETAARWAYEPDPESANFGNAAGNVAGLGLGITAIALRGLDAVAAAGAGTAAAGTGASVAAGAGAGVAAGAGAGAAGGITEGVIAGGVAGAGGTARAVAQGTAAAGTGISSAAIAGITFGAAQGALLVAGVAHAGIREHDKIKRTRTFMGKIYAEALSRNLDLESLTLTGSDLGSKGIQPIAESLQNNTRLRTLHLEQCDIGNSGVRALAKMLEHNRTLTELKLNDNRIDERGASALLAALQPDRNITLTKLTLKNNKESIFWAHSLSPETQENIQECLNRNRFARRTEETYETVGRLRFAVGETIAHDNERGLFHNLPLDRRTALQYLLTPVNDQIRTHVNTEIASVLGTARNFPQTLPQRFRTMTHINDELYCAYLKSTLLGKDKWLRYYRGGSTFTAVAQCAETFAFLWGLEETPWETQRLVLLYPQTTTHDATVFRAENAQHFLIPSHREGASLKGMRRITPR